MGISVQDYLLDQSAIDWKSVLSSWSWMLPQKYTIWLVNRFADRFLVFPDGTVHMLDVGYGTLTTVADNRDEFIDKIDDNYNANNWLMIPLVDQLVANGICLQPGYCYGFKKPPVLGGDYRVENCASLPIGDYLSAYCSIHEQIRDVPDGGQVIIEIVNKPAPHEQV